MAPDKTALCSNDSVSLCRSGFSTGSLVPLSAYFATDKAEGISYSSKQKSVILKWLWRSLFSRRFSSDVNERQAADIEHMKGLKEDENYDFRFPKHEIKFDFSKSTFSSANANSKTHILLLNSVTPYSLLSGAKIDLDKVLKKASKHEYHHIFPKKHLEREGRSRNEINVLANICFLTRADNNKIKDRDPAKYGAQIDTKRKQEYFASALIPMDFESLDYKEFIEKRTALLEQKARKLMA